jgi:hypothetical protein
MKAMTDRTSVAASAAVIAFFDPVRRDGKFMKTN